MNITDVLKQLIHGLIILLFQIVLFRTSTLFGVASCFIYVGFLIQLPFYISTIGLLCITFGYTLLIDIFYDSPGLHTAAAVFIMYIRASIFKWMTPSGGYDNKENTSIFTMGFQWHLIYAFILIFLHTSLVFAIEWLSIGTLWSSLLKIISTTLFTLLVVMLYQFLFLYKRSGR
ncbi:MAG: hypothetical protein MUE33_00440 [Cytophagaceae bacterium]|jgi:hypothetical protein|nr:hypothetical protein [Cytophagaceae bacterium]